MALPKPSNVLGKGFRVLTTDEVSELILRGQMQREATPPPMHFFDTRTMIQMKQGQPLFVWYCDVLLMVSYNSKTETLRAWEVKELRPTPPTIIEKVKEFFQIIKK